MKSKIATWVVYGVGVFLIALLSGCSSLSMRARQPAALAVANINVIECGPHNEIEGGMYPSGTNLVFGIRKHPNRTYQIQWFRNGQPLSNQNGNTLSIIADVNTVGFYTATVLETKKDDQQKHWFCGPHEVQVYSGGRLEVQPERILPRSGPSPDPEPSATTTNSTKFPFTLTASPVTSSGTKNPGGCPGSYSGYVNFRKTIANGWGWKLDTTTSIHTVGAPSNASAIEYIDKTGTKYLCTSGATAPVNETTTEPFRFTVYFPSGTPPPSPCTITLTGFLP